MAELRVGFIIGIDLERARLYSLVNGTCCPEIRIYGSSQISANLGHLAS